MLAMNLNEWSKLTVEERKAWLKDQSPRRLTELLVMINDMLKEADQLDAELSLLIDPSLEVIQARDFTYNTLRDVEYNLVHELRDRQALVERVA